MLELSRTTFLFHGDNLITLIESKLILRESKQLARLYQLSMDVSLRRFVHLGIHNTATSIQVSIAMENRAKSAGKARRLSKTNRLSHNRSSSKVIPDRRAKH